MNLRHAENIVHRYLITAKPLDNAPRFVRQALKVVERKEQAGTHKTAREQYNLLLQVRDELMERGQRYMKNAAVRQQLASYIEKEILSGAGDWLRARMTAVDESDLDLKQTVTERKRLERVHHRLIGCAERLYNARQTFTWGTHENGDAEIIWDDKSELLRLDPDEAREDSQRVAEIYVPALLKLADQGRGLHYLVLTIPNVEPGNLREAKKALFRKWTNFKRIQRDKNKAFAEIIGDIAIMEDPLAADGKWNIHLNVILVTQKKFHVGLYEKIRREWKFNVEIRPLKGDAGELARAFNELIKYSARAVPEKSQAKAARSAAPAIIEWPAARFLEWFDAQFGFHRTRSSGCLFGKDENGNPKVPKPEPRSLDDVTWHGCGFCRPDYFFVQLPLIDLTPGQRSTTQRSDRETTGPP